VSLEIARELMDGEARASDRVVAQVITTHSRMDGAAWVASVLQAQKSELDQLAEYLGEHAIQSARAAWRRKNVELTADLITRIRERTKMPAKNELETLRASFKACVSQEILRYRTVVGAGQLSGFAGAISVHAVRYQSKLDGLAAQGVATAETAAEIKQFADAAVRAAFERGTVELESAGD
jgi:hypothetical protein